MNWRERLPRTRRIALVGRHPATKMAAPWDDPRWQIWICSPAGAINQAPTWDVAFEIHNQPWTEESQHNTWLKAQTKPIVVGSLRGETADEVLLPRQEIRETFFGWDFYCSTISWMLGMAILLEPEEIALYGTEMEAETEYVYQRSSCCWLLGLAQGRGIKVTLPNECRLLKAPLYPPN